MKICIIASKSPPIVGGGETYIYQSALALAERGNEVVLITNKSPKRNLSSFPFRVIEIEGFNEERINLNKAIPQLFSALSSMSFDIIHIHNYLPYFIFSSTGYTSKAKVVFSIHNTPYFTNRVFGTFKNFSSEVAFCRQLYLHHKPDLIIVGSKYYAQSIKFLSPNNRNIKILPFGVDNSKFYKKKNSEKISELSNKDSDIIVVCPSRIIPRKGIRESIKAFGYLPKNFKLFLPTASKPVSLRFFNSLRRLISNLNLDDQIILSQKQYQHSDMPSVYNSCDIFLMPSYYEGFGIAIIEAFACNIPVVTTNVVGINEIVTNNFNAVVVAPKDVKSIATAIMEIYQNPKLKEKLITNAYNTVFEKFLLSDHMNTLLSYYQQIL